MIKGSKICGISDLNTLNFIINHPYPPQFIGFICNYKKSSRYVEAEKLNNLLKLNIKKSNFVAVLVKPDEDILEQIKHKKTRSKSGFFLYIFKTIGESPHHRHLQQLP